MCHRWNAFWKPIWHAAGRNPGEIEEKCFDRKCVDRRARIPTTLLHSHGSSCMSSCITQGAGNEIMRRTVGGPAAAVRRLAGGGAQLSELCRGPIGRCVIATRRPRRLAPADYQGAVLADGPFGQHSAARSPGPALHRWPLRLSLWRYRCRRTNDRRSVLECCRICRPHHGRDASVFGVNFDDGRIKGYPTMRSGPPTAHRANGQGWGVGKPLTTWIVHRTGIAARAGRTFCRFAFPI